MFTEQIRENLQNMSFLKRIDDPNRYVEVLRPFPLHSRNHLSVQVFCSSVLGPQGDKRPSRDGEGDAQYGGGESELIH
jgi:hypothetical protein